MSDYKQQEFDFVERTKKILEQYEKYVPKDKEIKFEVTLLLNSFVGLLIIPQQKWIDSLPTDLISEKAWGIKPEHISMIAGGQKQIIEIVRHLRNSLSHYRFTASGNVNGDITRIKFEDFDKQKNKTFEATIPIINLRVFLTEFSDFMLLKMNQSK